MTTSDHKKVFKQLNAKPIKKAKFIKFNQPKTSTNLSNDLYKGQSRLTPTIIKNNSIKFDLKGPIVCDNLFILNKKILFKNSGCR